MNLNSLTNYVFSFIIFACATLLESSNYGDEGFIYQVNEETQIKSSDFPPGFLFGASTSAYQVEGAYLDDDKSLSTWDVFCHSIGCGPNGENGDVADDHYHLFLRDIELMDSLGVKAYRFSISWSRVLPRGRFGEVNPAGIMFYNNLIDNLILKGIEPFVTIHHLDLPQELEDRFGAWLNPEMQEEFVYFAEICFKSFGDRVKHWITLNEPKLFVDLAYGLGMIPPSRCSEPFGICHEGNSDVEPIIVMHNMLLAHGKAAKLYHENFQVLAFDLNGRIDPLEWYAQPKQGGLIGLIEHCYMYEPLTASELDREAAKRAFVLHIGWAFDPAIFGDYPEEIKEYLGSELPSFSLDEKNLMKSSIDFIGINHYSTTYAKDCTNTSCSAIGNRASQLFVDTVGERDGVLIGEPTGAQGSYVVPRGMEEIVNLIKIRYNNTPMFVTENGYSSPDVQEQRVNQLLNDTKRVEYHISYLSSLLKSIRGGADVRGYFAWSLMDSYEWLSGYSVRFGLYYVDRQTLTRTSKLSARWYNNFLTNNGDPIWSKKHEETY